MQLPLRKISRLSQDSKLQLLYLKHTSISRLEGIKRIIKKNKCDCFIIILGIDSRFNRGSMDAASYLFFNAYEMNCDDLCHLKWEFDIFEDVFLCVCPNEVILYCNFASFSLIMPYVSHWPNLRIHFVNENLTNDPEKHEDLKISIFENTMSNLKKVCIPYTDAHGNRVNKFNKLMIENWPLIQSYAYDAKHQFSREFFTLSREVIDVGDDFYQLRQRIDPVFIERFLSKTIISFASSFELTLRSIDSSYQCTQSKELIDRQIKALTSMYKYSKSKSDNSEKNIYPPFLLYGSKTNKKYLKSPSTLSFLADESDNIHLIIHGSDQSTGISCERTYFIQKSIKSDSKQKKSLKALIQIYLHLLSAVAMLINQIKTTLLGFNEIISMTKEEIEKKIGFIKYDEIDIGLEYVLGEPNETVRLLTVMIRVYDVQVEDGETIGSIAFKDTLLVSALQLNNILISRNVINLTENIPCMCYWTPVSQILEHIDKETSEKEKCLLNGELEITSIPAGNVCLSSIKCNFYEDYIVLHGKRYGVTVLEPKRIYHYRSPDAFHPDFIELQVDSNFSEKTNKLISPYIYSTLLEETNEDGSHTSIWFIVKQRSKIRRLLIEHVFPTWRSRGLLELSSKEPNKYAVKASFSSYDLEQNFLKSAAHDDLIPEEILKRKIEPSDKECNLSITEILACQPSIKTWIQMYRDELSHAEASLCYVVPIPTANTCVDLCLKCGINPQSYIDMEAGEKVDWNYIFKKAVVWINHVHNNFKVITSSFEDEASNTHPGISKMDLKEINSCTESKFSYAELSSLLTTIKKPLIVTIICGPPGSQKELVVTNILNYANEGIEWIVMTPDNADEISTSLYKGLMKYCETQCNIDTNREIKSRCHGILLCPGITGPREVLASLAEFHREHGLKENITPIKIGCAATCVDLRMAIMDNGKMTFPGVLELIAEGWTNYLLLTGPSKSNLLNSTKMGVPFTEIEELLHSANPRLSHLFIPDGKIENSRTLEALMDENAFSNPILQRSRLLSYPSLCTLTPPTPRLHNIILHFNQPLDRKLFVNALNGIFENLKPWPFHGNIYTLNGEIAFLEDSTKLFEVNYVTLSGINHLHEVYRKPELYRNEKPYWLTCIIADASNTMKNADELTSLFADWIRETAPKRAKPRELIKKSDLTEEDLNRIHDLYDKHTSCKTNKVTHKSPGLEKGITASRIEIHETLIIEDALKKKDKQFELDIISQLVDHENLIKFCRFYSEMTYLRSCHHKHVKLILRKGKKVTNIIDQLIKLERYRLHPLPQGWYYTGTHYVNMNGEKSFRHPSIHLFIDEYIEGENTKIEAKNARLCSRPIPDLFS